MKPDLITNVANQSSREGGRPHLMVLHTTEGHNAPGLTDLVGLEAEFNDPSSEASSHVATDGDGNIARYVPDKMKAWTVCSFNPYTLNIEQVGFASSTRKEWFEKPLQLKAAAVILAEWSIAWGVPLQNAKIGSGLEIKRDGVCQHKDLGSTGCGHTDCGPGYPQGYVIRLAQLIVEEHHNNQPNSQKAKRLRTRLNMTRRRYKLPLLKSHGAVAGTKTA